MAPQEDAQAAQRLAEQAHRVVYVSGREPCRGIVTWITRGRLGRRHSSPVVPRLTTPWQDTLSTNRLGWRERAANLDGDVAFAVDYQVCRRCRLGWVEEPYTQPRYQRCGLASAGLAALRAEQPGFSWHTLGGHFRDSGSFWVAVGVGVPGGYTQRGLCPHVKTDG